MNSTLTCRDIDAAKLNTLLTHMRANDIGEIFIEFSAGEWGIEVDDESGQRLSLPEELGRLPDAIGNAARDVLRTHEAASSITERYGGGATLELSLDEGTVLLTATKNEAHRQPAVVAQASYDPKEGGRVLNIDGTVLENAWQKLAQMGAARAVATFSGYGDDGAIDYIDVEKADGSPLAYHGDAESLLRDLFDQACEATSLDWWNNDGGEGEAIVDITEGNIKVEVAQHKTEEVLLGRWSASLEALVPSADGPSPT